LIIYVVTFKSLGTVSPLMNFTLPLLCDYRKKGWSSRRGRETAPFSGSCRSAASYRALRRSQLRKIRGRMARWKKVRRRLLHYSATSWSGRRRWCGPLSLLA